MVEKKINDRVEALEKEVKELKEVIGLLKEKPFGFSNEMWLEISEFIKKNIVVTKEELINKFPTLLNASRFRLLKKALLQRRFEYIWFHGRKYHGRFVFIEDEKSPIDYAIKFFKKTKWGEPIIVNCPDRTLKDEINYWIEKIFEDVVTKSNLSPNLLKGSLRDRRKILRRKYK